MWEKLLSGTEAVKSFHERKKKKTKEILPVVTVTAAALLLKINWSYIGPEKVRCSVEVLVRSTGRQADETGPLVLKLLSSVAPWIYITKHFFSTGGAFPSAFSISTMILLKISTAVCIRRVLWAG